MLRMSQMAKIARIAKRFLLFFMFGERSLQQQQLTPSIGVWSAFLWIDICDHPITLLEDRVKLSVVKKLF
ncbi:MAG: hypothetical protein ACK568_20085 [Pseudanabaena sp.]